MIDTGAGFVALPNDYFDWLLLQSTVLTKRELAVLLAVIRNTIGYRRLTSRMSCRFIQKSTGIKASHVQETLTNLENKKYISIDKTSNTSVVTLILPEEEKKTKPFPVQEQLEGEPFPVREQSGDKPFPNKEQWYSQSGNDTVPSPGTNTENKQNIQTTKTEIFSGVGFAAWLTE